MVYMYMYVCEVCEKEGANDTYYVSCSYGTVIYYVAT